MCELQLNDGDNSSRRFPQQRAAIDGQWRGTTIGAHRSLSGWQCPCGVERVSPGGNGRDDPGGGGESRPKLGQPGTSTL